MYEKRPPQPWEWEPRPKLDIAPGEVTITYITHACMELKFKDFTMFFDPWLTGWLCSKPIFHLLENFAGIERTIEVLLLVFGVFDDFIWLVS